MHLEPVSLDFAPGPGSSGKTARTRIQAVCAGLIALAASAPSALAEQWPGFRGLTRQGISLERSLPLKWSASENVVWKTEIPGQGWSSPIVWGDRVFVTSATDNGTKCRVLCLDRKSGKIAWNKDQWRDDEYAGGIPNPP